MEGNETATLETRLAVVCYGGVSLAIYMSGITREIQELVTGSAVRLAGTGPTGTAGVYADLLDALEKAAADRGDPHRIQVGVDVVAGTSAGGINGICLTRALDGDYSQEAIRDFWITEGDFGKLLDPDVRKLLEAVRAQSGGLHGIAAPLDKLLGPPPPQSSWARSRVVTWIRRIGAVARLRKPVTAFVKHPPRSALYGDRMCQLTWGALNNMKRHERAAPAQLLFGDSGIDLAVTATEFAGHEDAVPLSRQLVFDEAHRHVFRIHGTGGSRLDPDVGMLAFAARATASFPGAFAPVSLNHFRGQLSAAGQGAGWDSLERRYLERYPDDNEAGDRRFVDGGVLDNMPFDAAIGLIRRRTAASEVRRAVVYVEPSPTVMANADALALRDLDVPESNVLAETFRSVSTIPLSQTMGDQIAALRRRNARVLALRSVIEQRFDAVAARVDEVAAAAAAGGANPLIDPAAAASPGLVGRRQRGGPCKRRPDADVRPREDRPRRRPLRRGGCRRLWICRRAVARARRRGDRAVRRRRRDPAGRRPDAATARWPLGPADRVPARVRRRLRAAPDRVHARWGRVAVPAGRGHEGAGRRSRGSRLGQERPRRPRRRAPRRVGHADGRRRASRAGDHRLRARRAPSPDPAPGARPVVGSR